MRSSPLSARSFFRDPVGYARARGENGEAIRLAAGPREFVLLRDPETIWRVLVSDAESFRPGKWKLRARRFLGETLNTLDGEAHRRRRLLLQPALDRRRIARFAPSVLARVERARSGWADGARIDLRAELDRLSLEIAGDVLLSIDLEPEAEELADTLARVMAALPRLTPPRGPTPGGRALARLEDAVDTIVGERRSAGAGGDDLVGVLLRSGLPDEVVRGEILSFLLAAVDEPPSALVAAWYLLAREPRAEARLHAELDATADGRSPSSADLARLPYLDAVLRETLRLYPPARHIDRCPVREVELGGTAFPAASNVLVSPVVTHRETRLYERADAFVPGRWLDAQPQDRPRGAYVPFGAGAHACIGEPLARMIMTCALASIGRRWRLRPDADGPEPVPRAPRLVFTLERR